MKNLSVENIYTRQKAKELTKKNFWRLLGMMLLVALITSVISYGGAYLLATVTKTATTLISTTSDLDLSQVSATFVVGYIVLLIVNILVSGGLSLGAINATCRIARGEEGVKVRSIFIRMKYCLKNLGLSLWVGFKVLLWALPVYVVVILAAVAVMAAGTSTTDSLTGVTSIPLDPELLTALMSMLPLAALILVLALVIPAALRYSLSVYVLADEPATGVFECVRKSKAMMKGHKWQCFKLYIPYLLKMYGWMLLAAVIFAIIGTILEQMSIELTVISGFIMIVLLYILLIKYVLRMMVAGCVYYLKRKGELPAVPPEEEERIVAWQPAEAKTAPESVASADDHIACWNPGGETKEDKE